MIMVMQMNPVLTFVCVCVFVSCSCCVDFYCTKNYCNKSIFFKDLLTYIIAGPYIKWH
jgi:hypothetical protein